jgi:hypothetical protein
MSCSPLYAPIRWLLQEPTWGHAVMHPSPTEDHRLEIRCANCLKVWPVAPSFQPSPRYEHRLWLARMGDVRRELAWRRKAA